MWHETVLDLGGLAKELAASAARSGAVAAASRKSLLELIQGGETSLALAREAWEYGKGLVDQQAIEELAKRKLAYPLKRVRLLAPIPHPARNVFCLGRNYADHAAERGAAVPEHPVYFTKPGTAVVGPGDDVVHHAVTSELDYEVELAAVIGTGGRDISRADALKHVFGYTIINDVTARDLQKRHTQWFKGKSLDTFCPMGPVLVTADELPNPQALEHRHACQRPGAAVEQYQQDDLPRGPVHRGAVAGHDAAPGRHHRHRHAGRRRRRHRKLPQGRGPDGSRSREDRRARQQSRPAVARTHVIG